MKHSFTIAAVIGLGLLILRHEENKRRANGTKLILSREIDEWFLPGVDIYMVGLFAYGTYKFLSSNKVADASAGAAQGI